MRKSFRRQRPGLRTLLKLARLSGGRPHLAAVLQEGRKSANIHASLRVIRGIPANFDAVIDALAAKRMPASRPPKVFCVELKE
jgi:hypothetical protein